MLYIEFILKDNISSLKLSTPNDGEILFDYSKNRIEEKTMQLLFQLVSPYV